MTNFRIYTENIFKTIFTILFNPDIAKPTPTFKFSLRGELLCPYIFYPSAKILDIVIKDVEIGTTTIVPFIYVNIFNIFSFYISSKYINAYGRDLTNFYWECYSYFYGQS